MDNKDRLELLKAEKAKLESELDALETQDAVRQLAAVTKGLIESSANNLEHISYLNGQVSALTIALGLSLQALNAATGDEAKSLVIPRLRDAKLQLGLISIFRKAESQKTDVDAHDVFH